jgi:anion-transporting  ArsA/GET3 family ATPase
MANDDNVIKMEPSFSTENELENLLKAYKDAHEVFCIDPQAQKDNEHSRTITETNLYSFNVGLLMGMRWKK